MTAGGLAGLCQTVVTTPMELLKIQLQLGAEKSVGHKASAFIIASRLISSQGMDDSHFIFVIWIINKGLLVFRNKWFVSWSFVNNSSRC